MGSFIFTRFFIALFAASIKLILAWFYYYYDYVRPNSFNYFIVNPPFFTPFYQIFNLSVSAFISRFRSFYFYFIRNICMGYIILQHLRALKMDLTACLSRFSKPLEDGLDFRWCFLCIRFFS
jgi:hypothetical protein